MAMLLQAMTSLLHLLLLWSLMAPTTWRDLNLLIVPSLAVASGGILLGALLPWPLLILNSPSGRLKMLLLLPDFSILCNRRLVTSIYFWTLSRRYGIPLKKPTMRLASSLKCTSFINRYNKHGKVISLSLPITPACAACGRRLTIIWLFLLSLLLMLQFFGSLLRKTVRLSFLQILIPSLRQLQSSPCLWLVLIPYWGLNLSPPWGPSLECYVCIPAFSCS